MKENVNCHSLFMCVSVCVCFTHIARVCVCLCVYHCCVAARVIRSDHHSDGSFTLTLSVPELERAFGKKFKPKLTKTKKVKTAVVSSSSSYLFNPPLLFLEFYPQLPALCLPFLLVISSLPDSGRSGNLSSVVLKWVFTEGDCLLKGFLQLKLLFSS